MTTLNNKPQSIEDSVKAKEHKAMIRRNIDKLIAEWEKPTLKQEIYIRNMEAQLSSPNKYF